VEVGDPAVLTADGPENGTWRGRVVRLAPEADPETRTITVFAEVSQDVPEGRAPSLLPGRFVLGTVSVDEDRPRVIIPRGAVAEDRVMVITGADQVQSREVDIAYYIESSRPDLVEGETQWAVLESGLEPGETIAISGLAKLRPGMPVLAVADSAEGAPSATARTIADEQPEAPR
jgi:membrane fusion protein (multidrug efflux system)